MKNIITVILFVCLTNINCKKNEQLQAMQLNEQAKLYNDSNLMTLFKINEQLIKKMNNNLDTILPYLKKNNLNNTEKMLIATNLGFRSTKELDSFIKIQSDLIKKLKKDYPLIMNSPNIKSVLINIFNSYNNRDYKVFQLDGRCDLKYNNCIRQANVIYSSEILGCFAGAIGVGSVTFGIGGLLFELSCGYLALEHLATLKSGCFIDFQECH